MTTEPTPIHRQRDRADVVIDQAIAEQPDAWRELLSRAALDPTSCVFIRDEESEGHRARPTVFALDNVFVICLMFEKQGKPRTCGRDWHGKPTRAGAVRVFVQTNDDLYMRVVDASGGGDGH